MAETLYTAGFRAGVRYQREHTLDFIRVHAEQGVEITVQDIEDDINQHYKIDMEAQLSERRTQWDQKN
jgi:hypothetical protein